MKKIEEKFDKFKWEIEDLLGLVCPNCRGDNIMKREKDGAIWCFDEDDFFPAVRV